MIWMLLLLLATVAVLTWLRSVALEERNVARARADAAARELELERERSKAEVERRAAERSRELTAWAEAERTRWIEQERAQVVADAEARVAVRFDAWRAEAESAIRKDAVDKSKAVVRGHVTEHLLPLMDTFPYDPRDCRFLGSPIDLIVFDGLYGDEGISEVVFIEVKTGTSGMNARERALRDAIREGRVRWEERRL